MALVERVCACCGARFKARSADVARGWAKFCTKSCKAIKQEARTGQHRAHATLVDRARRDEPRLCFPSRAEGDVQ